MSRVVVAGMGAVSSAGWSVAELLSAIESGAASERTRSGWPGRREIDMLNAPKPTKEVQARIRHPRLRRVSGISRFAVAAGLEALAEARTQTGIETPRVGVVFCSTCGCVTYSRKFFHEVLEDPELASPMLFPDTVFNAPASHLAAVFGGTGESYTLVGDSGMAAEGVALAANRLLDGAVDLCLVVAAEENDWLIADAVGHFAKSVPIAEGAGALALTLGDPSLPRLDKVTDPQFYDTAAGSPGAGALERVAAQLGASGADAADLLLPGTGGFARLAKAEQMAWAGWAGQTLNVKTVVGEGFAAGAMWQMIAAVSVLRKGAASRALVSLPGAYQFAIGAGFSI